MWACAISEIGFRKSSGNDFQKIDSEDKYYDCSINMITIDEKSGKERKTKVRYLVQGDTIEKARKNVDEIMGKTMIDYNITSLKETSIMDVFLHKDK